MQRSCLRFAACLLLLLPAGASAQGAPAKMTPSSGVSALHSWLAFTPITVETADSLETSIVLPNGRRAVLPADSGRIYVTIQGRMKRVSADSGLAPIRLDYVYLLDTKSQSHRSTVTGLAYYPGVDGTSASYSFLVPRGTVAARVRFGEGVADVRNLKPTHVGVSRRN